MEPRVLVVIGDDHAAGRFEHARFAIFRNVRFSRSGLVAMLQTSPKAVVCQFETGTDSSNPFRSANESLAVLLFLDMQKYAVRARYSQLKWTGDSLSWSARHDFRAFSPLPDSAVDFGDTR